jgi:hypothetical protein
MSHGCPPNARFAVAMRYLVYALAATWAVLMIASFVLLETTEPTGEGMARGLSRISTFLGLQCSALLIASGGLLAARNAQRRGARGYGLTGYAPFAVSLFVVVAVVAIIAYRVLVAPLFV